MVDSRRPRANDASALSAPLVGNRIGKQGGREICAAPLLASETGGLHLDHHCPPLSGTELRAPATASGMSVRSQLATLQPSGRLSFTSIGGSSSSSSRFGKMQLDVDCAHPRSLIRTPLIPDRTLWSQLVRTNIPARKNSGKAGGGPALGNRGQGKAFRAYVGALALAAYQLRQA